MGNVQASCKGLGIMFGSRGDVCWSYGFVTRSSGLMCGSRGDVMSVGLTVSNGSVRSPGLMCGSRGDEMCVCLTVL
eukprot:910865-Amorphochlora_amoeboformis.AAC.2